MTVPLTDSSGGNAQSQTGLIPNSTLIPITIGGKDGAGGNGGEITINSGSAITTQGKDAYGLLAQSIGGGGGLVIGTNNAPDALESLFPEEDKDKGNGATVTVSLFQNVVTTGEGAAGVVAQSIGGGGGLIGGLSDVAVGPPGLQFTPPQARLNPTPQQGQGGNVVVNLFNSSTITTSGPRRMASSRRPWAAAVAYSGRSTAWGALLPAPTISTTAVAAHAQEMYSSI